MFRGMRFLTAFEMTINQSFPNIHETKVAKPGLLPFVNGGCRHENRYFFNQGFNGNHAFKLLRK
ncbi:MAG: hypothetical protein OI74_15615 [Gammaproteobacteria bacterium (ex Lamellibrachia satsuma)]|nr:MAG: hypothetical protein OI74_15615 [Gammaproteobacteria bacterium (ex Lamellibrachia satsuma)]RRS34732.1 MAG: hypothetical protein NV67_12340 [Gammaproteobacteria bacterium (ex Lamellibrachia satsuma)]